MRWISYVRSRISKLPRRASRQQHDLNVVDQWVVRLLCRFGACTYRRVEAELQAIRGTPPAEVVTCLLKLEAAGLIERGPVSGLVAEERVFRLTRQGRRLARLVTAAPRSPTIFYP